MYDVSLKKNYIGRFKNEVEAALEYDRAARNEYGDYANCNFPLPTTEDPMTEDSPTP